MFQCFRFPNIDFEWTGSSASMCEKNAFFQILKNCFFCKARFHSTRGYSTKREPQRGFATFLPIPQSQSKNNLISHHKELIPFHSPAIPAKRVHSLLFHKGNAKKKSEPEKCIFCKAGFVLWVGLGTEKEELQHLISESHKASAPPSKKKGRVFFFRSAWLDPCNPCKKVHSISFCTGNAKRQFFRAEKLFFCKAR